MVFAFELLSGKGSEHKWVSRCNKNASAVHTSRPVAEVSRKMNPHHRKTAFLRGDPLLTGFLLCNKKTLYFLRLGEQLLSHSLS